MQISFDIESDLKAKGYKVIAGFDEAGRGSLAGPLVVGMVIFNSGLFSRRPQDFFCINDSKKLTPKKRESAFNFIRQKADFVLTEIIPHTIIDDININKATELAVQRLIDKANITPDVAIMDGNFKFNIGIPMISVIKGDSLSFSIAAGGIAAKVTRDNIMREYDLLYGGYEFKQNMGYGTKAHLEAIYSIGPSEIHRLSYEPVKSLIKT